MDRSLEGQHNTGTSTIHHQGSHPLFSLRGERLEQRERVLSCTDLGEANQSYGKTGSLQQQGAGCN